MAEAEQRKDAATNRWRRQSAGGGFNRQPGGAQVGLRSSSRGWWRGSRSAASIGGRGDGQNRSGSGFNPQTGGRPEQNRRTGGRRAGCRRRAAEFQVRPVLSPLPSLLSFLRSLSLPALKRCGGPRGSIGTRFPARDRLTLRVASSRRLSDALAREATPYERRAWRRRRPNPKLAWTPRRHLGA